MRFTIPLFTLLLIGCFYMPKKNYLDNQHPEHFIPCPSDTIESPAKHAFIAIQASLADNDWVLEKVDSGKMELVARKCIDPAFRHTDYLKRNDIDCLSVKFMVKGTGDIYAITADKKKIHPHRLEKAHSWMGSLNRNYSELRCYNDKKLLQRSTTTP